MLRKLILSLALFMVFSPAIAQVCLDEDGETATGIRNLEVLTDEFGLVSIDLDFINTTGFSIYGPDLDNMPFNGLSAENDVGAVELQINNALDAVNPVPLYVGVSGQTSYYIGVEEETEGPVGFVAAIGSENLDLTVAFWDLCTGVNDCLFGARVLPANEPFVYADIGLASGLLCGIDPPPPEWPPSTPPEPSPRVGSIPTLSAWALITLSILFGLMVFAKRRRLFKS
jgi:hypothetical protein